MFCVATLALIVACDKASHESIDEWMDTQKGPGKLEDAMKDSDLSVSLRGHAVANLMRLGLADETMALEYLEKTASDTRARIIAEASPRLWKLARTDKRDRVNSQQVKAKDSLFYLREIAEGETQEQIDSYLIQWLTTGYYAGRSKLGRVSGEQIMRAIGPAAGDAMVSEINEIIVAPVEGGRAGKITQEMIIGAAATGSAKVIEKLLAVATSSALLKQDPKLLQRVLFTIEIAYASPKRFKKADSKALVSSVGTFRDLAVNDSYSSSVRNVAIELIEIAGMPACEAPYLSLIANKGIDEDLRWVASARALDCGKLELLQKVLEAFPEKGSYWHRQLADSIWESAASWKPRADIESRAIVLLSSENWVARISGVEILGKVALGSTASEAAAKVASLGGDKTVLRGWWGDQSEVPRKKRKRAPTLGTRAKQVAKRLEELAKSGQK